jgi:signal peptidase I
MLGKHQNPSYFPPMIEKTGNIVSSDKKEAPWDETIRTLVVAVLLAMVFRSFVFEPFHIPSESMRNTLLVGDYIFVSKSSYGYSHFSFPLGIRFFDGRVCGDAPERGDVVVFRPTPYPKTDFIKRLIGLPGDKIQVTDGVLFINGEAVMREALPDLQVRDINGYLHTVKRYRETLDSGATYVTLDLTPTGGLDFTDELVVPEGHYFMMGDNRDNSTDSRDPSIGFVPENNLIGKAKLIFFSVSEGTRFWEVWKFFTGGLRSGRFFKNIDTFDDSNADVEADVEE